MLPKFNPPRNNFALIFLFFYFLHLLLTSRHLIATLAVRSEIRSPGACEYAATVSFEHEKQNNTPCISPFSAPPSYQDSGSEGPMNNGKKTQVQD